MVRVKPFAKITKPALTGVFPRRRLLHRLDSAFSLHPIVWVGAPAGTGKTMLASSFAQELKKPCLWYGIDARDADPASFFFFMRAAGAQIASRRVQNMPLPPQGFALDLAAYARSFFEELGARLPAGTTVVIDDYHELPDASPLQPLIPVALASLPGGVRVIVASRASPPASFARLIAHGRLARLHPDELCVTNEEIEQLARVRKLPPLGPKRAAAVRARTGGWMAGTILLLERSAEGLADDDVIDPSVREVLFEYFDSQIYERAPAQTRRFLLETALLPTPSADAALLLTGEKRSAEILSSLVRRNWFTARLDGANDRYRYHPLFREFLLAQARRALPGDQWVVVTRRAADVLCREGAFEDAAALMIDLGDHESLAQLVVEKAPALLAEGRLATIEGWIHALPSGMRETNAWLSYWLGICRNPFSPSKARTHLDRAYRLFKASDDWKGMLVAWAGFVTTFRFVLDEFAPLDHWIAELEALRRHHPEFPSLDVEGQVTLGMMSSLMWRQSGHPEIGRWVERAASLLRSDLAPELRMQIATYLALYRLWWKRDDAGAVRLLEETRPLIAEPDVAPQTQLLWLVTEAACNARMVNRDACYAAVERGLAKAEASGIAGLNLLLVIQGIYGALASGDLASAARYLDLGKRFFVPDHATSVAYYHHLGTWVALCANDLDGAEEHARAMDEFARRSGADFAAPWTGLTNAHVLVERGRYAQALELIEQCIGWSRRTGNALVEHNCMLSEAYVLLAQDREGEAAGALRAAMALGREHGFVTHPWIGWRRNVMSRLAALALEHDIESDHVRAQIRALRLPAPPSPPEQWPFPFRIYALGEFEIWRGDQRLSFDGRARRKPIELLQALLAHGGSDVREDVIAEALWPDADGDAAHHALETNLYRLRKLLGARAIHQRERRLSLDAETCWADAVVLQRSIARVLTSLADPARAPSGAPVAVAPGAGVVRDVRRIAQLYRGPLLSGHDDDPPWAAVGRERLRRAVTRLMEALDGAAGGFAPEAAGLRARIAEVDSGGAPAARRATV